MLEKLLVSAVSGLFTTLVGAWILGRTADNGKPSAGKRRLNWAIGTVLALTLFFVVPKPPWEHEDVPTLQSIEANPNSVKKGDDITIVVRLDRPAPKHGISVFLSSSDQSILTTNGNAIIEEGQVMGTGYFKAVATPNYRAPIKIVAAYKEDQVSTQVSFTNPVSPEPVLRGIPQSPRTSSSLPVQAKAVGHLQEPQAAASAQQPRPDAVLDPELVSRLEEALSRFSAEKNYWDNVKEHMPPGSSIRPEITSQIYAAQSTSGRCTREEQVKDAAALSSCVEALDDHLNQLKLQH